MFYLLKLNKDKNKDIVQNGEHLCSQCKSHFLTIQPIDNTDTDTNAGQSVQSIKCRDCRSQRKEIWTLPNWFWLRSSSPDNYWTEKWNTEPLHSDVQVLELAQGINDSLKEAGFYTVHSILKESPVDIYNKLNL